MSLPLPDCVDIPSIVDAINALSSVSVPSRTYQISSNYTYQPTSAESALMLVNSASAALTITLSTSIPVGTRVIVKDFGGYASSNNITLSSSASIDGLSSPVVLNVNRGSITLIKVSLGLFTTGRFIQNSSYMDNITMFERIINRDVVIGSNESALSVGPVTVSLGKTISVSDGGRYAII